MPANGILVNFSNHTIIGEITYDKHKRVDEMYYKVGNDIIPAAYIFPIENRQPVQDQLNILKKAKLDYDNLVADIYYKVLPTLR